MDALKNNSLFNFSTVEVKGVASMFWESEIFFTWKENL